MPPAPPAPPPYSCACLGSNWTLCLGGSGSCGGTCGGCGGVACCFSVQLGTQHGWCSYEAHEPLCDQEPSPMLPPSPAQPPSPPVSDPPELNCSTEAEIAATRALVGECGCCYNDPCQSTFLPGSGIPGCCTTGCAGSCFRVAWCANTPPTLPPLPAQPPSPPASDPKCACYGANGWYNWHEGYCYTSPTPTECCTCGGY